jgi:hypothetical protein
VVGSLVEPVVEVGASLVAVPLLSSPPVLAGAVWTAELCSTSSLLQAGSSAQASSHVRRRILVASEPSRMLICYHRSP